MNVKVMSSWAGVLSILWMLGGYVLLPVGAGLHNWYFEPVWLSVVEMFSVWIGVALLAVAGLRRGTPAGKVPAITVVVLSAYFVWHRPGLDELPHTRPTRAERQLAEENWQQLEKALTAKDLEAARGLIGRPILFGADFDSSSAPASARRARVLSEEEEKQMSGLPQSEQHQMITRRFESLPKVPCRWGFTRLQKQVARSCCSVGVEVYGILTSVSRSGIEVEARDFGIMLCL